MSGLSEYTRDVDAGASSRISVRGNFIRVKDISGSVRIRTAQNQVGGASGEAYSLNMRKFDKLYAASEFDEVTVESTSDTEGAFVTLQIGYGDYTSEVISRTAAAQSIEAHLHAFIGASAPAVKESFELYEEDLLRKKITITLLSMVLNPANVAPYILAEDLPAVYMSGDVQPVGQFDFGAPLTIGDAAAGVPPQLVVVMETTSRIVVSYDPDVITSFTLATLVEHYTA